MKILSPALTVIGAATLLLYLGKKLRESANADTKAVTATTKGQSETLTTTPIKSDPGFIAGERALPVYATPNLGSLTFRNVYDKFMPFGSPVSARADFNSIAPPEAKPTIYIN